MQKRGRIADDEMFGTFNMGLGMVLVVDRDEVPRSAQVIGEVVEHTAGERVVIR
jgi:phosphoribosylformylglycinamidine cyclo-ligase